MPYEDLSTQYPSIRGIAVELPFVKFKYVKIDKVQPENTRNTRQIDVTVPSESRSPAAVSRMVVSDEAEVTTLGLDTMISYASVLHELTYGRIDAFQDNRQITVYPAVSMPSSHSLDVVI
jgi:hypothetical protein